MPTDAERCKSIVHTDSRDVRGHLCGRPVKEEGLCGIHLAALRKRDQGLADMRESWASEERKGKELDALIADLAEFGIEAGKHVGWRSATLTGNVTVDPAQLLTLLRSASGITSSVEGLEK